MYSLFGGLGAPLRTSCGIFAKFALAGAAVSAWSAPAVNSGAASSYISESL